MESWMPIKTIFLKSDDPVIAVLRLTIHWKKTILVN